LVAKKLQEIFVENIKNHNMAFEKHMMHGDGESEMAETNAEHLKLKKMGWGHKKPPFKMNSPLKGKRGLWDNIHAKRARGEKMRSKGDPGAPSEQDLKDSQ